MLSFLRTAAAVGRSMMPSADQSFSKSGMTDAFRKKKSYAPSREHTGIARGKYAPRTRFQFLIFYFSCFYCLIMTCASGLLRRDCGESPAAPKAVSHPEIREFMLCAPSV